MKQLLTEIFNIKNGTFKKKDGGVVKIAYIDPNSSESTYAIKDEVKKYGAKWISTIKAWGWFLGNDPQQVYQDQIKPCLEYLTSVEQNPNNEERNVLNIIDKLIQELDGQVANVEIADKPAFSDKDIKAKLQQFKEDLINIVSDEEFKAKMLPIIKFRQAQGHSYSFANALLFYIQDPESTMIKSKTGWAKMNRTVNSDARALWGWVGKEHHKLTKDEKNKIIQQYLRAWGLSDESEMNPGQKDILRVKLNPIDTAKGFKIVPCFYDVRFTTQIEGKEDLVGNRNTDLPWYDDKGEVTESTEELCNAILEVIGESGVKVSSVSDLGGARGVSKSGSIEYLSDAPKNSGLFNTLCHEFAHELLHQTYLSKSRENANGYGDYFIGTSQGRGKVEQQAELCAWIVCRNFGYDMPTNINYVGIWGMDEKAAPYVFDTVAKAATRIIQDIGKKIDNNVNESINRMINEITGLEVARLVGCEDAYIEGKKETENDELKRSQFQESFNRWMDNLTKVRKDHLLSRF